MDSPYGLSWESWDFSDRRLWVFRIDSVYLGVELGMVPLVDRVAALQKQAAAQPSKDSPYPSGLTKREVEVLLLVAAGRTDREIADDLIISVRTVNTHVGNILNKTGSANRAEAVNYANQNGLVEASSKSGE